MNQPGKVANPARGQLNRKACMMFFLFPFAPDNLVSRDGFGRPVPCQAAHSKSSVRLNLVLKVVRVAGAAFSGITIDQLLCALPLCSTPPAGICTRRTICGTEGTRGCGEPSKTQGGKKQRRVILRVLAGEVGGMYYSGTIMEASTRYMCVPPSRGYICTKKNRLLLYY